MWRALLAGVVASLVAVTTFIVSDAIAADARADAPRVIGPGLVTVDVGIRYSKFSFSTLQVRPGTVVRFVVHNDDPINHEFIVGDAAVHERHQSGSEAAHPPVPGEVSVKPLDIGETFYRFDRPGRYEFACHLPGHLAYGMKGWVTVTSL